MQGRWRFQLHHTGIKTKSMESDSFEAFYFNCTIQELKRCGNLFSRSSSCHFNCTIQELKQKLKALQMIIIEHFNCTIQELKRAVEVDETPVRVDFNCTIQELKPAAPATAKTKLLFQLHHTGIKTFFNHFLSTSKEISIAPYRN